MKIFDFFDLDIRKQNQSKFRKIKLLICSLFVNNVFYNYWL